MAIAYVNGAQSYSTFLGTSIAAPATSHTSGNLIVVIGTCRGGDGTDITSITDTAGNTYTRITGTYNSFAGGIEIWYAKNITGNASNVVTINFNGSYSYRGIRVHQYSGCDTTSPLDQSAVGTGTSTAPATASVTTTQANEVLVGGDGLWLSQTHTAGTGYTIRTILGGAEPSGGDGEDRVVSSIGTYTASYTLSGSTTWIIVIATFKQAAAGGLSIPVAMHHYKQQRSGC